MRACREFHQIYNFDAVGDKDKRVAKLSQRDRATATWVKFGQKRKRIYSADIIGLSSSTVT